MRFGGLLPRPPKKQCPATYSRSQNPELHPGKRHECGSFPSAIDVNLHPQLPRRLAHSGPVRGSFNIAQDTPPQPLMLPGVQGQLCQEHTVTQPTSIIPGDSYRLQMTATVSAEQATVIQRHAASFKDGTAHLLKAFQKMLGLMAAVSPVLQLGLLRMQPIQFWLKQRIPSGAWHHGRHHITLTWACVSALAHWRDLLWLKQGMILDMAHRRMVVMTDASNKGWGALLEGKPTFGLWSKEESGLHINCLEMLAVCHACQFFLPDIRGHHVLVPSDSRSEMSSIKYQGGLVLKRICMLANDLLVWAQTNLSSLKATHMPGKINQRADVLTRKTVSEEWRLHPLSVQKIWEVFGRAGVDLFASKGNSHCSIFFTMNMDVAQHE